MCTAATYKTKNLYFGRTLDNDFSYNEEVTVTPRNFLFQFRNAGILDTHYAIIGMAYVCGGYPLYYDAMNEMGLCVAGLNFVGNAVYNKPVIGFDNIAQFEFLPWVLGKCSSVDEACALLKKINITNDEFSSSLPTSQLHWFIADKERAVTVESVSDGLKIFDNPVGVLTNNPPFDEQMNNLEKYNFLSAKEPEFYNYNSKSYSKGVGAIGLPGDLSSKSRFVRAAFVKRNSVSECGEEDSVNQFFHILNSVEQQRGCCVLDNEKYEITVYTSCCNADKGIYYYTTYGNHQISAVDMHRENLDGNALICYSLTNEEQINRQN